MGALFNRIGPLGRRLLEILLSKISVLRPYKLDFIINILNEGYCDSCKKNRIIIVSKHVSRLKIGTRNWVY